MTRVSSLGNLLVAGLNSQVLSYLVSPENATLCRPSPMWKWAMADPRMWPALWNVSLTSGAMSVVSLYLSVMVWSISCLTCWAS